MTWIIAILLAVTAFAVAVFGFGLARQVWSSLLAALALGLAGYAMQASPDIDGAPVSRDAGGEGEQFWQVVDARKDLIGSDMRSGNDKVLIADGFTRRGQYARAVTLLGGAVEDNPRDVEAWLALGIALTEHADGQLTPAALFAYGRASGLAPESPAPGYFLGVSLIRQGRLMEARSVWADALSRSPEGTAGREAVQMQFARLEDLLSQVGGMPPGSAAPASAE